MGWNSIGLLRYKMMWRHRGLAKHKCGRQERGQRGACEECGELDRTDQALRTCQ